VIPRLARTLEFLMVCSWIRLHNESCPASYFSSKRLGDTLRQPAKSGKCADGLRGSMSTYAVWEQRGYRKVATGTWLYDRSVPMKTEVWAKPARFSFARFDEDDQMIESRPIPETRDGFLYFSSHGSGEHMTIEEARAAADAKPWGPIKWD
jgi:hypothetical protein